MARLPRLAVAGLPHLVLQRAAPNRQVFRDEGDCADYLAALAAVMAEGALSLHAWALVPEAAHLLVTPAKAEALGQAMQRLGRRFAPAYNRRHGLVGSPWAGRFRAGVVDPDTHLLAAMRYVEQRPVSLGLAAAPEDYPWSSAAHHTGRRRDPLVREHPSYWRLGNTPFEREVRYAGLAIEEPAIAEIESAGHKGWAVGSATFHAALAKLSPRRAAPLPRGRKRVP